jgi:hypothetical protein
MMGSDFFGQPQAFRLLFYYSPFIIAEWPGNFVQAIDMLILKE